MGLKDIFKDGTKEFKRRFALRKENKNLKQKQKVYSQQLTILGKKAWESKLDIDSFGNLEGLISGTQKQQDELKAQLDKLEKQKQETEDIKKEKNETFEARKKEVEEKKKEVDSRLDEERDTLKDAKKESENAIDRLERIAKDEERLNKKAADPQTPGEEKNEIKQTLDSFVGEREELNRKSAEAAEIIKITTEKIKPIEEESSKLQEEIDRIRAEQKEVIGELDKSLSDIGMQINENNKKLTEVTKEQEENFEQLGEKLSGAGISDEAVGSELSEVKTTEKEMAEIKVGIEKLEQEGTPASRSALWKMVGVLAGFLGAIIVVIIVLMLLFGSGDKKADSIAVPGVTQTTESLPATTTAALEKYKQMTEAGRQKTDSKTSQAPKDMKEAMEQMQTATGEIKKRSEQLQGKEIVVADKAALATVLPTVDGWKMEEPVYDKGTFGQLETANLRATYTSTGADSLRVDVDITDTATASALLSGTKMFISMNIAHDNENKYRKISDYNGVRLIENYDKRSKRMEFTFIVKDRYLVAMRSKGEKSLAILKDFITKLDFSKLE